MKLACHPVARFGGDDAFKDFDAVDEVVEPGIGVHETVALKRGLGFRTGLG